MRFHIVNLPHTQTTKAYSWCAYTAKVVKFCAMLKSMGHEVFVYSGWENEAPCTEHVQIVTREDHAAWCPGIDWTVKNPPIFQFWDPNHVCWTQSCAKAVTEITRRAKLTDFVGIISGICQAPLANFGLLAVEWGIGYEGVLPNKVPKCFESYAWRYYVRGSQHQNDFVPSDVVIPNSFEASDFPLGKGGDYYVYLGRLIRRKGVEIAAATCRELGAKLILAGQGVQSVSPGKIVAADGMEITGDVEHIGTVNPKERAKLLGGAKAAFVPTTYFGPFEGVAVEAMLCGTPVISTDWGVFSETIHQGVTGYRCSWLPEFVEAAKLAPKLDRARIREINLRYSTEVVKKDYQRWFDRLDAMRHSDPTMFR